MAFFMAEPGKELGAKRVVVPLSEVALKLAGESSGRSFQSPGNGPQRLAALKQNRQNFTFFFVQMCVGVHRPPFYPRTPLHQVLH